MNIKEALSWGKSGLKRSAVLEPESSAEVLLSDALGCSRTELLTHLTDDLEESKLKVYRKYIKRRQNHEPVWQIIGKVDFWGMPYEVDKNVLVPRPETEILVKEAVAWAKTQNRTLSVLDLGTGSGTIIVALANELNNCSFFASDLSGQALKVAKNNAKRLAPDVEIEFKKGDLMQPWKGYKFDLICTNLPYIPHEEMPTLAVDVVHNEPRVALDGGLEGMEVYGRLFSRLSKFLTPNAAVFCEIGINQGELFKELVQEKIPNAQVEVLGDLAGIDRVVIIKT